VKRDGGIVVDVKEVDDEGVLFIVRRYVYPKNKMIGGEKWGGVLYGMYCVGGWRNEFALRVWETVNGGNPWLLCVFWNPAYKFGNIRVASLNSQGNGFGMGPVSLVGVSIFYLRIKYSI